MKTSRSRRRSSQLTWEWISTRWSARTRASTCGFSKPGQGERATPGQRIAIHYTGWLPDGTRIEATRERGPVMVTIGEDYLIDGIMEGVEGIRIGEERLLVIKPELGYETLEQSGVPPNSWLVFRVTRVTPPALGTAADAAPVELQAG